VTTHPCTFSHPSADRDVNVTPVLADCASADDGLLRSGNFEITGECDVDVYGNAAALPAFSFLQVRLQCDGKTLLQHLRENSEPARQLLLEAGDKAEEIRSFFLSALGDPERRQESSSRIKQVYFPVGNGEYHLLSVLTPALGVYEMKQRIEMRRQPKEDGSVPLRIPMPIIVGFGGSKPQNISFLNNKSHGTYYLLPSVPPELASRSVRLPKRNFFKETLFYKHLEDLFKHYARLSHTAYTNIRIRDTLNNLFDEYIDRIVFLMCQVRKESEKTPYYDFSGLPRSQQLWLDPNKKEERIKHPENWIGTIENAIAESFLRGFRVLKIKDAPEADDVLLHALEKRVDQQREVLL
jgi:CRISPR-associated protein Csy1